jgi:hypothetical protein
MTNLVTRKLKTPDGRVVYYCNGKLHNWDGPAIKYPKGSGQKEEYYIHGIQYTKETWAETKRDFNGVPPAKDPKFQTRM